MSNVLTIAGRELRAYFASPIAYIVIGLFAALYGAFFVLYLLLFLIIGALVYTGWRMSRTSAARPTTRVIGPDDDPEFMWRLSHGGDNNPR